MTAPLGPGGPRCLWRSWNIGKLPEGEDVHTPNTGQPSLNPLPTPSRSTTLAQVTEDISKVVGKRKCENSPGLEGTGKGPPNTGQHFQEIPSLHYQ